VKANAGSQLAITCRQAVQHHQDGEYTQQLCTRRSEQELHHATTSKVTAAQRPQSGYCRVDGRQHYFPGAWDSAESRSAYDAFLDAWLQKHDPNRSVATIGQLCLEYVRYADATYRKHGQPTGEVNNIRSALKLLLRTHRHATLREISLPILVKWRDSLIGRPDSRFKKRGRTISRQYINRCTKIVLRMLRWARQKGIIEAYQLADVNQIDFLKANRSQAPEASKSKLATDEQVEAAVEHLPPHIAAMVELQRLTGMRPGEVIVLRPCDVTIRTDGVMAYRPHIHKLEHHEGIDRVVMIGPRAQEILRPWLDRDQTRSAFNLAR
jgi:integrase